jgi:L-lactate dehydrogenase
MKKATSLSELGFDANGASSGFFRPVSDDSTPTSHTGGG